MFKPSEYQQAIFSFIQSGKGHGLIEAVAGSGKTTTIVEALKLIQTSESVCFLAFNKAIQMELQTRVPKHVQTKTLNGLGHGAWMKTGQFQLDGDKIRRIVGQFSSQYPKPIWESIAQPARRLAGLARAEGLVPTGAKGIGLTEDTDGFWFDLMNHHDITFSPVAYTDIYGKSKIMETEAVRQQAIELTRKVLTMSILVATQDGPRVIDFDDQLYLPVIFDVPMYQYQWLFVDEAQDISLIQLALITKALRKGGRLVAVGDPKQAIYSFRGASHDSMEKVAVHFNATRLPLSVSYRCPRAVVREAQKTVQHILPSDSAPEGEVNDAGFFSEKTVFTPGDLVVCRNNAPLVRLAYNLIKRRMAVKVLGRDIGLGLLTLIDRLSADSVPELLEKLSSWHARETDRILKKDPDADISAWDDKKEVIEIFATDAGCNTVQQVKTAIENLFQNGEGTAKALDPNKINLSSIHKSKGLEAHHVIFLNRSALPSKYAKKPHQLQSEDNLVYVAVTRAKSVLTYLEMPLE